VCEDVLTKSPHYITKFSDFITSSSMSYTHDYCTETAFTSTVSTNLTLEFVLEQSGGLCIPLYEVILSITFLNRLDLTFLTNTLLMADTIWKSNSDFVIKIKLHLFQNSM
jgi:hypothetical protein